MKKGFTLVELITVIVILGILVVLLVPKVLDTIEDNRIKGYQEIESRLIEATKKYLVENYVSTGATLVTSEQLITENYIEPILDLKDNSSCNAVINVTNMNNNPVYKVNLTCSNYTSPSE